MIKNGSSNNDVNTNDASNVIIEQKMTMDELDELLHQ